MKNIICILCLSICIFWACEPKFAELEYKGESFVMHKDTLAEIDEGSEIQTDTLKLKVLRASQDASEALTVSFQTSAKYLGSGADAAGTYTVLENPNSVVIPAGKFEGIIKIKPTGNSVIDAGGSREVTVTLSSVNAGFGLGYPGKLSIGKISKVTIEDDDCPFNINTFTGRYNVTLKGLSTGRHITTFVRGSGSNIVNANFNNYNRPINYTVSASGTVTIPQQAFFYTFPNETGERRVIVLSPFDGIISPCSGKMEVPFEVYRTAIGATTGFTFFDEGTHVFKK